MITENNISLKKSEYTLRDFAVFKLCPMMYKCSVLYPEQKPISNEQRRLHFEAEILRTSFEHFVKSVQDNERVYFKNTSLFLTDMVSEISQCLKAELYRLERHEVEAVTNNLYDKAELIADGIHRWIKGSKYTIMDGITRKYPMKGFTFIYKCAFRSADVDNGGFRSIYIDEYNDFPVFTAGKKNKGLIHYADIMESLDGDDYGCDRAALAMKIIRKINIQIETGYYEQDGLARIDALGREITTFDFDGKCKKPSEFCTYCKYFDKCREFI